MAAQPAVVVDSFGQSTNQEGDAPRCSSANESVVTPNKKPHRVLHFSDGTFEENSDEDEVDTEPKKETVLVDPTTLTWMPWFAYQAWHMGSKSLEVCDYLGEKLAAFFGITTPKYQYVIDEYNRMIEMEKEAKKQMDVEMGAWVNASHTAVIDSQSKIEPTVVTPPKPSHPVSMN